MPFRRTEHPCTAHRLSEVEPMDTGEEGLVGTALGLRSVAGVMVS